MTARIFLEGGGDSKDLHSRCREAFRKLLERCGFQDRMARLTACGGREAAYRDFEHLHTRSGGSGYIAMLVDSEEPVADIERTWEHLAGWPKPEGAEDDQVFFMTTCMETWIVADREALSTHYPAKLRANALPSLQNLEQRSRQEVQKALTHATRDCSNAYAKGERSFRVLGELNPETLTALLPSFARMRRILNEKLK